MKLIVLTLAVLFSLTAISKEQNEYLQLETRVMSIYKETVPAVVNVSNIKVAKNFWYGESYEVPQGSGTGFVWDNDGHIVTNYHVVDGGDSFSITFLNDKEQYTAEVIGVAPRSDIAVLKLKKAPKKVTNIKIGSSSNLQVGQLALAIGNPLGFDHSLSRGIISALDRKMDGVGGVKIHGMVQTDAAINQGNSGGPLLDSQGRLIGMNTMIVSRSGSSAGLGFAVPVDTINRLVPQLIKHGKIIRPGFGIGVLEDHIKERYIGKKGAVLSFVDPQGAAGKAGLKGMMRDRYGRMYLGDIITEIDGKEVNNKDDIYQILGKYKIGETVKVRFIRDGKTKTVTVKLRAL